MIREVTNDALAIQDRRDNDSFLFQQAMALADKVRPSKVKIENMDHFTHVSFYLYHGERK